MLHAHSRRTGCGQDASDLQPLLVSKDTPKNRVLFEELSTLDSCSDSTSDTSRACDTKKADKGDASSCGVKAQQPTLFKKKLRWYRSLDHHSADADDYDEFLLRNVSSRRYSSKGDSDESVSVAAMSDWTRDSALNGKDSQPVKYSTTEDDGISLFDEMSAIYSYNAGSLVSRETYYRGSDANENDESFDLSTLATLPSSDEEHNIVDKHDHRKSIEGENEVVRRYVPPKNNTNRGVIILGITDDVSTTVLPSSVIQHPAVVRKRGYSLRTALNCFRRIIMDPFPLHIVRRSKKWEI